jgi:hypothetical protein
MLATRALLLSLLLAKPRVESVRTSLGSLAVASLNGQETDDGEHTGRPGVLSIRREGEELLRVEFSVDKRLPNAPRFRVLRIRGIEDPIVVAVGAEVGGSDHHFETAIIGIRAGKVVELLQPHVLTSMQDAVCVVHGGDGATKLLVVQFECGASKTFITGRTDMR